MPWPRKIAHFGEGSGKMKHEPKPLNHEEIKKLVYRLKNLHVGRMDAVEAAQLIELAYCGPRFHHKKRGSNYTVVGAARLQFSTTMPKDGDMLTLYRGDDGVYSVRAPEEFNDGRFVEITKENEHEYAGSDASHS